MPKERPSAGPKEVARHSVAVREVRSVGRSKEGGGMKSDRDLLELAAKAAGYANPTSDDDMWQHVESGQFHQWNPLDDDGDALRLAVKLGLSIHNEHENSGVTYCTRNDGEVFPDVFLVEGGDPPGIIDADYAGTRRAIVIAAAYLAESMP